MPILEFWPCFFSVVFSLTELRFLFFCCLDHAEALSSIMILLKQDWYGTSFCCCLIQINNLFVVCKYRSDIQSFFIAGDPIPTKMWSSFKELYFHNLLFGKINLYGMLKDFSETVEYYSRWSKGADGEKK